jgi:hypothetical protein
MPSLRQVLSMAGAARKPSHAGMRAWPLLAALCACISAPHDATRQAPTRNAPSDVAGTDAGAFASARLWPEAAARFRSGGEWLGADGAYTIDLGPTRVLWLFADTFLDPKADGSRVNGPNQFIRNSAHDLSRSTLTFHWGPSQSGTPSSFFHDFDGTSRWLWPLHGARLPDGKLLVFRMQVVSSPAGFGFAIDSWDAIAIDDPAQSPDLWRPRLVAAATKRFGKLVGSSVLLHQDYLYAYAVENQARNHAVFLARWRVADLAGLPEGALGSPEWFSGRGFEPERALSPEHGPAALFVDGQVEFSVHYEARAQRFVQVQMQGLFVADPNTRLAMRTAVRPEGPWSALQPFFRPEESRLPDPRDLAAYAAKAHPEQRGADVVVTYIVNDTKQPTPGDALYYPQPLQLQYRSPAAASGMNGHSAPR